MNRKLFLAAALSIGVYFNINAQQVWFTGLGRAVVQNDDFKDAVTDTAVGKATGGYTLFDLGVNAQQGQSLKAHVILRLRNEFGGFFGDGSAFEFRQMRLEGLIGRIVKYEIGDLDVALTPYTIHNYDEIYNDYESELFRIKRDVVNYENFYTDNNTWRMQGVNAFTTLKFDSKAVESLGIRAFGNRIIASDFSTYPDRWLFGGRLDLTQSDKFRIGANMVNISDIAGVLKNASTFDYDNTVITSDLEATLDKEKVKVQLTGEFGISDYTVVETTSDSSTQIDDFFFDAGVKGTYKPLNITLGVSYRNVGADFNSPGAQSRRITPALDADNSVFPTYLDGSTGRSITLFDRYSQEVGMYNRGLTTTLAAFLPQYNNVTPYGIATANRKGLTIDAGYEHPEEFAKVDVKAQMLSEINGEGTVGGDDALRNFTALNAGFRVNIGKIIGWEKTVAVNYGLRYESTTRETNPVDFVSTLIDAGLDIEALKKFNLLLGYKYLGAKGDEFIAQRNEFNQITGFSQYAGFDIQESVVAIGAKYSFSKNAFFSVNGQMVNFKDNTDTDPEFDINQIYFIYSQKF